MKKTNKGFTLVELIIVVAIIAVLAAVLAPQYLRYVERSREANDIQVATQIMRAATVAMNDPINNVPSGAQVEITWYTATTPPAMNGYGSDPGAIGLAEASGNTHLLGNNGETGGQVQQRFRFAIISTMGLTHPNHTNPTFAGNGGYDSLGVEGQSNVANTVDFSFQINSTTGEITDIPTEWVDLGIKG